MSLTATSDPFNRNLGKNLSAYDVPHQLRVSAQYEAPRFHEGIFKNNVLSYIVSGWGTGWYLNYQSAALVGLPTSSGSSPISNFLGYGPGPAQLIPGMSPWSVNWTDYGGVHHTTPLDINCHCFNPTKTQVLNPNAFTNVPNGAFAANEASIFAASAARASLRRTQTSAAISGSRNVTPFKFARNSPISSTAWFGRLRFLAPPRLASGRLPLLRRCSPQGPTRACIAVASAPSFRRQLRRVSAAAHWSPAFRSSPASHSGAREIDLRAP